MSSEHRFTGEHHDSHPVKVVMAFDGLVDAHPLDFHALGLAGVIDQLAVRMRSVGLKVALEVGHGEAEIDRRSAILLYRATDELFRNIVAHALAQEVKILLQVAPGAIQLSIQDDGVGFHGKRLLSEEATDGGLRKLHRVIGRAGGYLDVESSTETGTCVTVQLPLD
ncbi:two-component system sensor histidine kinase UhpB [Arthrobacter globiformis]|uniref:sensor histidine kinase n=1 Tax=Arthrobacter globiformis TaxID=1665 RepID=UPI00278839C5|nr:ATP-binding protein [Arthrobacter globiformis]MDQ1059878.1 two-component system sensor histidine kinase UhpB [Arthrobacter globiformis]